MVNAGKRIFRYRMCFPVYRDGDFKTWHLDTGLRLLSLLGDGRVQLDHEIVRQNHSEKVPFFEDFRDPDKLHSLACYNEFKFDWPEPLLCRHVAGRAKERRYIGQLLRCRY